MGSQVILIQLVHRPTQEPELTMQNLLASRWLHRESAAEAFLGAVFPWPLGTPRCVQLPVTFGLQVEKNKNSCYAAAFFGNLVTSSV